MVVLSGAAPRAFLSLRPAGPPEPESAEISARRRTWRVKRPGLRPRHPGTRGPRSSTSGAREPSVRVMGELRGVPPVGERARRGVPGAPCDRGETTEIDGSVALVTGANRGLGLAFARELVSAGHSVVYGAARDPAAVNEPGLTPIALDITDSERVAEVAQGCSDVDLLVNNAGVMAASTFLGAPSLDAARSEMETNYFGTLGMCRAFAPVLAANGGGAVVNMLSVTSFYTNPIDASYGASKAAAWSLTNGIRIELAQQGTQVVAVHAKLHRHGDGCEHRCAKGQPRVGRSPDRRRPRGGRDRGAGRRAFEVRQGIAATRPRADLSAGPGVLGRAPVATRSKGGRGPPAVA